MKYIVGFGVVFGVGGFDAYVLWRYPKLRAAFIEHWRPAAIAERMDAWSKRHTD